MTFSKIFFFTFRFGFKTDVPNAANTSHNITVPLHYRLEQDLEFLLQMASQPLVQ